MAQKTPWSLESLAEAGPHQVHVGTRKGWKSVRRPAKQRKQMAGNERREQIAAVRKASRISVQPAGPTII